jgi:DNA-binding Xre family transcriptional regulator
MATLIRMPLDIKQIKDRRVALTLTMEEAADRAIKALRAAGQGKIKFTRQRWNDIEHGRFPDIRLSTAEAIASVLECGIDDLRTAPKGGGR